MALLKTGLRLVYDESGHLLGEYDLRGNLVQELVWLDDLPVASLRPDARGGRTVEVFHIHPDHLGTPRQITDSADRIVWRWDSPDPFGNAPADDNPDDGKGKKSVFEFNLRFPGQYFDGETGLHYNYYRDYDPSVGRYVEADPIGLAGGLNLYAYALNNPVVVVDETGLAPKTNDTGGMCSAKLQARLNGGTCPDWTDCLVCCGDLMPFGFDEAIPVCAAVCMEGLEKWKKKNPGKCDKCKK